MAPCTSSDFASNESSSDAATFRLLQYCLGKLRDNFAEQGTETTKQRSVLTYSNYDAEAGHLFELLRWKNLASQQQIQRAIMVYKSLHGLAPDYSYSKFERQETAHNLRDSEHKLNVPLLQTNYYKNSFSYSGATLWNRLPRDIRQAESLKLFTCLIKEVCSGMAFVESSFS